MTAFCFRFYESVLKKYAKDPAKLKQAVEFVDTCESAFLFRHGAFDWNKILLNDNFLVSPGSPALTWNGKGYEHLLGMLLRKFGDENRLRLFPMYFSTLVTKIEWGKNGKVQLKTKNGQQYEADHVIFTPSVGVLKEKHRELFTPNLPAHKIDAIEKIGFDAVVKVALQYEKKWWTDDIFEFTFVYSKEDEEKLSKEYKVGPQKVRKVKVTFKRIQEL